MAHDLLTGTRLDATPILTMIDRRGGPEWLWHHGAGGTWSTGAYWRARRRGWVTALTADRLLIRLFGLTIDEVYGPGWDDGPEVAA